MRSRMMKMQGKVLPGLIVLSMTACAPVIREIQVTHAEGSGAPIHVEPMRVVSNIEIHSGGASTPEVRVRPVYPENASYQRIGELPDRTEIDVDTHLNRFTGEMAAPSYGGYDLKLDVGYTEWLVQSNVSSHQRLLVEAPDSCFAFDGELPLPFDLGPVKKSNGEEFGTAHLAWRPQNWPFEAPGHGAISFQISTNQFPNHNQEPYYWMVDFMAKGIPGRDGWLQSNGVTFRAKTDATGIYAQPIFLIRDPDNGEVRYWAPKDMATGKFLMYPISESPDSASRWKVIEWSSGLPEGVREAIYIRIYGDSHYSSMDTGKTLFLDGVCPIPPGVTPAGGEVVEAVVNPWL